MLLIWKGYGFFVPLIWVASILITSMLVGQATFNSHGWPKLVADVVAAIAILLASSKLNERSRGSNTFFFMNMEIWGVIFMVLGVLSALNS